MLISDTGNCLVSVLTLHLQWEPGRWAGCRPAGWDSILPSVSWGGSVLCVSEVPSFLTRGSSIVHREEESVASGLKWVRGKMCKIKWFGHLDGLKERVWPWSGGSVGCSIVSHTKKLQVRSLVRAHS